MIWILLYIVPWAFIWGCILKDSLRADMDESTVAGMMVFFVAAMVPVINIFPAYFLLRVILSRP